MTKIGRNQLCPCGSGKKYKHCCLRSQPGGVPAAPRQVTVSLKAMIQEMQEVAASRQEQQRQRGVFLFFSTRAGDAWLLEMTEQDAVQIAEAGEAVPVSVQEDGEVVEVDWSHTYVLRNRQLVLTSYRNGEAMTLESAPAGWIRRCTKKMVQQFSPEVLSRIHLDS